MTPLEQKLANALNRLMFSADHYIEDGSWLDVLDTDINNARKMLSQIARDHNATFRRIVDQVK